jgi:ribose-phosphate pyrophosphokinase
VTTLALLEPPLRRLFERIDFAPRPKSEHLKQMLSYWAAKRSGSIAPTQAEIGSPELTKLGIDAFSFRYCASTHHYLLAQGGETLRPLLGIIERGDDLSTAPFRRAAVRLRRLFEVVRRTGEPVLAEFVDSRLDQFVEIVAAPLSSDSRTIDGLVGALTARPSNAPARHKQPFAVGKPVPLLFALSGSDALAERIASHLGIRPSPHEFRKFEDGEHKGRPLMSVRDRDVYVLSSLWSSPEESVNDKLCRLLFFVGCLRDGAARRVTALIPYFGYARKDRKTKPRDPVTIRYVAQMLEAVGADRVVAMEIHNVAAYQNAFRRNTEHIDAAGLFAPTLAKLVGDDAVTVVSPDLGGGKRAEEFRERLEAILGRPVERAFMEKRRSLGVVTGELFAGEVLDRTAIIVDDLISSGTTMARAARACHERGAKRVYLVATHGLFAAEAAKVLSESFISGVLVTDTVPQAGRVAQALGPRLTVLSVGTLLGEVIRCLHDGGSITELLGEPSGPVEASSRRLAG